MFQLKCRLYVIDSGIRHPAPFEEVEPLLCRLRTSNLLNKAFKLISILHSFGIGGESAVLCPLGLLKFITKDTIQSIVPASEHEIAIFGLEAFVWYDRWMCRAPSSGIRLTADETG